MKRVLIVEDELIPANYLKRVLTKEGYAVVGQAASAEAAVQKAGALSPDIILMDIMLEGGVSGIESAMQIRLLLPEVIIIFLTAYSDGTMIDEALETGAYAYLVKPYRDGEIIATMKMAARQCEQKSLQSETVRLSEGYVYERTENRLQKGGDEVELGPKALELIALLCRQPGMSMSHEQIRNALWEEPVSEQTLRSLVHRIREATHRRFIENVSKTGYKITL